MKLEYRGLSVREDGKLVELVCFDTYVGFCLVCGRNALIMKRVEYADGVLSWWGKVYCFGSQACIGDENIIQPLQTLAEQEPYHAAYTLGGWQAVWAMLDQKPVKTLV